MSVIENVINLRRVKHKCVVLPQCVCKYFLYYVCSIHLLVIANLMVALFTHWSIADMIHLIHRISFPFVKGSSESPTTDRHQNDTLDTSQRPSVTPSPTLDNETEPTARDFMVTNTQNWANQVHLIMHHMDLKLLIKLQDTSWCHLLPSVKKQNKTTKSPKQTKTHTLRALFFFKLKSKAIIFFLFEFNIQWCPGGKIN